MKERYCVDIIRVVVNIFYDRIDHESESHFFDDLHKAEMFRKWSIRKGLKVSEVMDLENLPF
jgi:predicted HTH transcriptional regulator